ncbi:uncharacterized protein B0H64DRAFT_87816 [Chaetomium fimeti]|uniref:Diphthine--ammonia ligase n=1 Tax=Chaetomium fimeti TaxID=1854472 RepID=A0AAE0HM74_9PEZI|nr:hypothetical protein B0H64DRAFT_87816 [Chaetomium fimeti]
MASNQADGGLNVIALVSGGKDSFFSLLHCRANGHRVVALANLHPILPQQSGPRDDTSRTPAATASVAPAVSAAVSAPGLMSTPGHGPRQGSGKGGHPVAVLPGHEGGGAGNEMVPEADEDERDLNSFMYQTVGHQVIPLYAEATGIPLYRRAITGGATQHGKDYSHHRSPPTPAAGDDSGAGAGSEAGAFALTPKLDQKKNGASGSDRAREAEDTDETESMVPLLLAIKKAHPEANAICAGAILSTYQRTRVESVATRLGLTPLAYLWKFPVLPTPGPLDPIAGSDAQLLDDMAAAGVEARIIKVASGGLDDAFLWTNVASAAGKGRLARAMRRFGAAETGAVIGEGGEFETLVLDGPPALFRKRIVVAEGDRRVVREGGGSAWLSLRNARLEDKAEEPDAGAAGGTVRIPDLLDSKFVGVMNALSSPDTDGSLQSGPVAEVEFSSQVGILQPPAREHLQQWSFVGSKLDSVEEETRSIVEQVRQRLREQDIPPSAILSATVILRRMADFPAVNSVYGTLFDAPNPPSRVTISCGDAAAANIAIYLTVHTALQPNQRHGLHVQSRSYWAPANIGPYSQAISIPVSSLGGSGESDASSSSSGARLVSIAGQIPLVPATMALPVGSTADTLPLQLSLSLQHLWRIGLEMGVQWWTSAVAYFPVSPPGQENDENSEMRSKAQAASTAWTAAHTPHPTTTDDDDNDTSDDETGPDLWDRRYNPAYMTFTSDHNNANSRASAPTLPDRSVLATTRTPLPSQPAVPPLFVAEVDALPRAAAVEWHAHLGVARAGEGAVHVRRAAVSAVPGGEVVVWQVVVDGSAAAAGSGSESGEGEGEGRGVRFVQTVVAERCGPEGRGVAVVHGDVAREALSQLGESGSIGVEPAVVVRYVDATVFTPGGGERGEGGGPVVPCLSLWDGDGERLAAVTVYQSVFE